MNVLLSIKPEFADRILTGEKRYEFRRSIFKDPQKVDTVFMYASLPVQRIVGMFTFSGVIEEHPEALWDNYGSESGMKDKKRFLGYFDGKESGYAIEIEQAHELGDPVDPKTLIEGFRPPVSFQYVNGEFDAVLDDCALGEPRRNGFVKIEQYP